MELIEDKLEKRGKVKIHLRNLKDLRSVGSRAAMLGRTETVKCKVTQQPIISDVSCTNENLMYHFTSDSNETKCT